MGIDVSIQHGFRCRGCYVYKMCISWGKGRDRGFDINVSLFMEMRWEGDEKSEKLGGLD